MPLRAQTRLDVSQALAKRQLRERHAQILIHAAEALDLVIAAVPSHAALENHRRQVAHQLREHQLARVHRLNPWNLSPGPP
jgi:RNase P protein component